MLGKTVLVGSLSVVASLQIGQTPAPAANKVSDAMSAALFAPVAAALVFMRCSRSAVVRSSVAPRCRCAAVAHDVRCAAVARVVRCAAAARAVQCAAVRMLPIAAAAHAVYPLGLH